MKTKVLIITYYWPPAGGPGVQRWLKFVKYLPQFGVQPIVYCPENPSYPITDRSLLDEIPENTIVVKRPIKEPYRLAKFLSKKDTSKISSGVIPEKKKQSFIQRLLLYVRGNYFIPDARVGWVKPSVSFLSNYIKENAIDTIITTGPPHSMHLIGLGLKQKLGVRWLADFRDPWTTIGYHKALKLSKSASQKHLNLETKVLQSADQLIVTSRNTAKEFQEKTEAPISVITNGYDEHDVSSQAKDSKFSLSHIGSLLSERNPELLWQSLSELIDEERDFASDLKLNLFGVVSDAVLDSIITYGLKDYLKNHGYVNHDEAIKAQLSSQLLLLIEINSKDTKAIIPGKLFEYLHSKTPILALGPEDSDVQKIIQDAKAGAYFNYEQKDFLKAYLVQQYRAYKSGGISSNTSNIEQYSRKALTEQLAELIHQKS
ncbi:glycosyltransferase [Winogradskyella maritima]|uniref:Glycosyltransferase n=1 Tax=Winogradskyella maritima TaxID=1517766 RepID=A0ABV8AL50_9FLAO|nr:glycosyltransferase [Winogradskyella maritima]